MKKCFDSSVIGSDHPRSFKQFLRRKCAGILVKIMGLNSPGVFSTEIVQEIEPVAKISTRHGDMHCMCGHGRLLWRVKTFFTEEPQTIEWLDNLKKEDTLWDVGANVGLYSIYAAKFAKCKVLSFEPESQNYALLVRNIALNSIGDLCMPSNIAITNQTGMGHLNVRYITQGGAYNMFETAEEPNRTDASVPGNGTGGNGNGSSSVKQLVHGVSLDDLVLKYGYEPPTHLKIDVDGLEPWIIEGSLRLLGLESLRSILIEINRNSERDMMIPDILSKHGFELVSERSNWLSREDSTKEHEMPTTNMIFSKKLTMIQACEGSSVS